MPIPAGPVAEHAEFVERAVVVDPVFDEQALLWPGCRDRALGIAEAFGVTGVETAEARSVVPGLGAMGRLFRRGAIGGEHVPHGMAELLFQPRHLKQADENLLGPKTLPGPARIGGQRPLGLLAVAIGLREIERIARHQQRIPFDVECGFEPRGVERVGVRIAAPSTVPAASDQQRQFAPADFAVAVEKFVQHAAVAPTPPIGDELRAAVTQAGKFDVETIGVGVEGRQLEAFGNDEFVVGIDQQCVVGARAGEFERLVSVMCKIDPRPFDEFAGNVHHEFADDGLRIVA